jgi:hypothetical protein
MEKKGGRKKVEGKQKKRRKRHASIITVLLCCSKIMAVMHDKYCTVQYCKARPLLWFSTHHCWKKAKVWPNKARQNQQPVIMIARDLFLFLSCESSPSHPSYCTVTVTVTAVFGQEQKIPRQ